MNEKPRFVRRSWIDENIEYLM